MAAQKPSKYQEDRHVIVERLRNELCQRLSCDNNEKPKTVTRMLVEMMFSEEMDDSQTQCCFFPVQKKTNADKANQKKLPVFSSCLRSQSFHTSANHPEQSSAAMLPFSGLKVEKTRSLPNRKTKRKTLQESLWQERYDVKESGILNKLSQEEILLQEVSQTAEGSTNISL